MLKKALKYYLICCGLALHIVAGGLLGAFLADKINGDWQAKETQRATLSPIDKTPISQLPRNSQGFPDFQQVPAGKWIKVHQQTSEDPISFHRQRHSGSAWDSIRNKLIIFGSDTHGKNWDNSIYTFDLANLVWQQESLPAPMDTYRADNNGIAISGNSAQPKPWAMHTFDAINYLPHKDQLLVASYPRHLKPGRFGDWLTHVWDKVSSHPTWIYSFQHKQWHPATGTAAHFFPYATAYDSNHNMVVGFQPYGVFEFRSEQKGWQKVGKKSVNAYHTQAIYDPINSAFLIFGGSTKSNAIHLYHSGDERSREMPTEGIRPPGTQYTPFAFHDNSGEAIALIDTPNKEKSFAETWSYNLKLDRWKRIETAELPFKVGMNYHMQYSKYYNMLILCTNAPQELPSVWILRL